MTTINKGSNVLVSPGDYFNLVLPDGTILNVEQTADDFSICRPNGFVAYTKPTNPANPAFIEENAEQTTGRN